MPLPVALSFLPASASVHLATGTRGPEPRTVSFELKPEHDESLATSDGRSLNDVQWSLSLNEGENYNEHMKQDQAIGVLGYLAGTVTSYEATADACHASVAIPPEMFSQIWLLTCSGRLPDHISLGVTSIEFGDDSDGKDKVWDVKSNRSVYILEVRFRFPVAGGSIATATR